MTGAGITGKRATLTDSRSWSPQRINPNTCMQKHTVIKPLEIKEKGKKS